MSYPFDAAQTVAWNKLLADIKDFLTPVSNDEEANAATFNLRLNEIQGVIAHILQAAGGGNLDALSDVDIDEGTLVTGHGLVYDGTKWTNGEVSGGSGGTPGSVDFSTYQLDIPTTPTTRIDDPLTLSERIYNVENIGEYPIFLGSTSAVTSLTGFKLDVGDVFETILGNSQQLWAIAEFAIVRISVMKGMPA